jgi:hypothetical protein
MKLYMNSKKRKFKKRTKILTGKREQGQQKQSSYIDATVPSRAEAGLKW